MGSWFFSTLTGVGVIHSNFVNLFFSVWVNLATHPPGAPNSLSLAGDNQVDKQRKHQDDCDDHCVSGQTQYPKIPRMPRAAASEITAAIAATASFESSTLFSSCDVPYVGSSQSS